MHERQRIKHAWWHQPNTKTKCIATQTQHTNNSSTACATDDFVAFSHPLHIMNVHLAFTICL